MNSLGDRMKGYESVSQGTLTKRMPVILRVDGKAFHTYTRGLEPMDRLLMDCMQHMAGRMMQAIQGAKFCYGQSDEISFLITDYEKLTTQGWFDNKIQKMSSVAASLATGYFMDVRRRCKDDRLAFFDARVFNLPREEVANYFVWRQKDAERNSIQSWGRMYLSHAEMQNLSNQRMQDLVFVNTGDNWNDLPVRWKRGWCRSTTGLDENIPIFTQDRKYIEQWVYPETEE